VPVPGGGCPVPGCGHPYLAWHRFGDDEAVALCLAHREQAAGAPPDRLRRLERPPAGTRPAWLQRKVLARVGGNFFYETPTVLRLGSVTSIGFGRDERGDLLLTLRMPTASGQPRAVLVDSFWEVPPAGAQVVSPPSGRLLDLAYPDGDRFRLRLLEVHSAGALQARFGAVARWAYRVEYPVTLAEISLGVANTDLAFGPDTTDMGGPTTRECFTSHGPAAIEIPITADQEAGLFPGEAG
jgi:hypothetical protein